MLIDSWPTSTKFPNLLSVLGIPVIIPVNSYDDSTREGGGYTAAMEHTGRGDRTPDLQDVLPGEGRTAEISSGGVSGQSGGEGGNAGALCAPACPQHRGDSLDRKLPPPTVIPM